MILTINGKQAALKKGSSIEYVSENRIFTAADDYSTEIELPLADCPHNLTIFGMITRKDVDKGTSFLYIAKKMKPLKSEKTTRGASFWNRDPVGTFGQYFRSRYDTLKYCGFVIYD